MLKPVYGLRIQMLVSISLAVAGVFLTSGCSPRLIRRISKGPIAGELSVVVGRFRFEDYRFTGYFGDSTDYADTHYHDCQMPVYYLTPWPCYDKRQFVKMSTLDPNGRHRYYSASFPFVAVVQPGKYAIVADFGLSPIVASQSTASVTLSNYTYDPYPIVTFRVPPRKLVHVGVVELKFGHEGGDYFWFQKTLHVGQDAVRSTYEGGPPAAGYQCSFSCHQDSASLAGLLRQHSDLLTQFRNDIQHVNK